MHETKEPLKPVEQAPSAQPDDTTWQAPAFEVVDTALEVTAYSLSTR
ncbi:pyrroloquinoline quinone precursor peptide PqqA [Streptomyces sp. WAC 01325]|uniref:Coenzyme PQQ synthesis protein A n=1 Tax=Streptomyces chartreusis TaxID=1969 RepID=A0A7H8TBV7_STRCX|nr:MULTISPECIES: pyrroloquinoline quinone precursor peptide PqqA [Streptomyces]MCZ4602576.1 pyrroloquinoline quinone precursor peptide PqqA [Streptomyces sp. Lzd4kr]WCH93625.1 pyrroloquinoline quinone precursor peptide PqqA [Streptomyces moderatus]MBT1096589.1 pyrroloquinoline quinone precursor peptide PqqA [Streptomyces sp. Tu102]QEV68294.1 pyrroloquinoline quinone precursor peptide PqqA [Streptomyces chartreusis]QKZ19450.1 pyrroloquinoline quinone precursor peptide PqqA [Streptomyces chartre